MVFQKYFCVENLTISSWLGFGALGCAHYLAAPAGTSLVSVARGLGPWLANKLFFSETDRSVILWQEVLQYQKKAIQSYVSRSNRSDKALAKCTSAPAQDILTCLCTEWAMTSLGLSNSNHSYSFMVGHNGVTQIYPPVTGN